ncbi:hypothetical protein JXM83_04925 [Candidatus Woesearchaeota archaeon]|nr:hypothetical protein [Candidatus Woesearchaeota archaeon]
MNFGDFANSIREPDQYYVDTSRFIEFKAFLSKKELAFIDSGFQEISEQVFFVKVHAGVWKENEKTKDYHAEFLISFKKEKQIFNLQKNIFSDFILESITENIVESSEKSAMIFLLKELESGSLIIRDGSFDNPIFNDVISISKQKGILILALSKSTTIQDNNSNITKVLYNSGSDTTWFYNYEKRETYSIFFVRLHRLSKFSFRLDIPNFEGLDVRHPIEILASNCVDPVFLGYPYGLIDADSFARVSNEDANFYKVILETQYNLDTNYSAHSILDKIRF